MAISTKSPFDKLSVALNIVAALCSMLIGIPWLIRHNRNDRKPAPESEAAMSESKIRDAMVKLQNSGYSSLTPEERAMIAHNNKNTDKQH